MRNTISLSGDDTITLGRGGASVGIDFQVGGFSAGAQVSLNGGSRVLYDLADGDVGKLTFPNDIVQVTIGKNGNVGAAKNNAGIQAELTLRILQGSSDDAFLTSIYADYINDPVGFRILTGSIARNFGDGHGNVTTVFYDLDAGFIKKDAETVVQSTGAGEQLVSVWTIICTARKSNS